MRMNYKRPNFNHLKMDDFFNTIINEFIPKTKVNKFVELLEKYKYDTNGLVFYVIESNNHKIPIEKLKERLFSKKNEVQIEDTELTFKNTLEQCDRYEKKIRLKGKEYYYCFGLYLSRLKYLMSLDDYSLKEINIFIEERYHIKISTINKYIRFNELCNKYSQLLNCDLSFRDVMQNITEIEKLLTHVSK